VLCNCDLDKIKKDLQKPPLDCPLTWQLFADGNTKAVFQLESQLGRSLSKKLKPENIEQLSDLLAILRPGSMEAMLNNKSMTDHYIDRKNYLEPIEYFHDALEPILKSTLGILVYQEQSMRIATDIAGMSLSDADKYIRKGIGKKKPEIIAKVKKLFLAGCKKTGIVNKEEARDIFEWIKKGQRYIFNKCLNPNTIVELESTELISLDEIEIGQKIKYPKSDTEDAFTEVKDKFDNGYQELYKIETESGYTIECTLNHKFLCGDGIIRKLSKILSGDHTIMCEDGV